MHSSVAYISTSAELRAVMDWRLETQWIGPPNQIRNPDKERDLNRSSSGFGFPSFGVDWSCGPQFASVSDTIVVGSMGNFTKEFKSDRSVLLNTMPSVFVPLRYLMTHFAAWMWPLEALVVYCASMLVIGWMSGRVDIDNQLSEPTSV